MRANVGDTDRRIRMGVGALILSMLFWGPRTLWALLGLPVIIGALTGRCVVYPLVGVTTRPMTRWERIKARMR